MYIGIHSRGRIRPIQWRRGRPTKTMAGRDLHRVRPPCSVRHPSRQPPQVQRLFRPTPTAAAAASNQLPKARGRQALATTTAATATSGCCQGPLRPHVCFVDEIQTSRNWRLCRVISSGSGSSTSCLTIRPGWTAAASVHQRHSQKVWTISDFLHPSGTADGGG